MQIRPSLLKRTLIIFASESIENYINSILTRMFIVRSVEGYIWSNQQPIVGK
jgi:hypothetical protein